MTFANCCRRVTYRFFEYDTPKIVHIRSLRVGILFRMVQLLIIAYIIGVVMIYKKGYQEKDDVESTVTSKVKGIVMTNNTHWSSNDPSYHLPNAAGQGSSSSQDVHVWDTADYVVPPQENGAFFVTTNFIITPNQEQGKCAEKLNCNSSDDCPVGSRTDNGILTGNCIVGSGCEVYAWCPVESANTPAFPQLAGTEDFTVLIKNQIIFPKFNVRRRNILDSFAANESYLSHCRYHPEKDSLCPIFRLGDIVSLANESYTDLAIRGAVLGFVIQWDCDFDWSVDYCKPKYSFRRIDNKDDVTSKGWNFRYANYWAETVNGTSIQRRTLVKAFGLRVIFYVYGTAGKFNFVPFATNLGAGLALLGLSVVICDIILLYCTRKRSFYAENKYHMVKDDDALFVEESQKSNYSYRDFHSDADA